MAYSREQQLILESMGIRLYAAIPAVNTELHEQRKYHAAFWQTRLGQNIQLLAKGHDLTALPVSTAEQGIVAKRIVWQHVRALLKSV